MKKEKLKKEEKKVELKVEELEERIAPWAVAIAGAAAVTGVENSADASHGNPGNLGNCFR